MHVIFYYSLQLRVMEHRYSLISFTVLQYTSCFVKDFDDMTDEEQLAMALHMSLQSDSQAMETEDVDGEQQPGTSQEANSEAQEFDELAENREFLQV